MTPSVHFGPGLAFSETLFDSVEAAGIARLVDAAPAGLRHGKWDLPQSRMTTIGDPLYQNRDRWPEYVARARADNRVLYRTFRAVHERVAGFFERRYGEPVVYAEDLAVPGFHVFEYAGSGRFEGGGWHFDLLHLGVPYLAAHVGEVTGVVNFTLPIEVPSGGTGMDLCSDEPGTGRPGGGATVTVPYVPGTLLFTERTYWHRIGASVCERPGERRVTYQGHGVRFRGRWILFW